MMEDQRGNAAQAAAFYAKAAALAPDAKWRVRRLGASLCSNGSPAESLALFDRALADPAYPTPAPPLANAGSCALVPDRVPGRRAI